MFIYEFPMYKKNDMCFSQSDGDVEEEGEESKWQDRISSGFDRLVAFASTELDKRRRSTEGNDSCNTSPDSGIGHGDMPPTAALGAASAGKNVRG